MATFPSLEPLQRSYGLGATAVASVQTDNGDTEFFLASEIVRGVPIRIQFPGLTLAEADSIQNHYIGQRGGIVPFDIPAAVWRMHTNRYDVTVDATLWRYAAPPQRSVQPAGFYSVEVAIVSQ